MGATLVAFMLVGFPVVNASKPNSFLYGVKRTIEDVRSFVQPSFNEELIDKRDAEIEDAKNRGDHEAAAIVEQEKSEIEQRLSGDDSSSSDEANTQDGQNQTETETEHTQTNDNVSSSSETETEHQQGGGGSDDSTPATTEPSSTSTQNRSARDTCRSDLDARRRAGENINSDLYKACDKL
jgi:hypothetical protein